LDLLGAPDRVLSDVIEVHEVRSENDFSNEFVNSWAISELFPAKLLKDGQFSEVQGHLSYRDVSTTFGHVDIAALYPEESLPDMCVLAKSKSRVKGELLFSATGKMFIVDVSTGKGVAEVAPSRVIRFYNGSVSMPKKDSVLAIVCANSTRLAFMVGYIPQS
jgi:hypothetical protein